MIILTKEYYSEEIDGFNKDKKILISQSYLEEDIELKDKKNVNIIYSDSIVSKTNSLIDLSDVSIPDPQEEDLLVYNSTTQKFEARNLSSSINHNDTNNLDFASSGHTGFQPAGDYATNTDLTTHTTNNDIHREIDDLSTLETDLWSANKISSELANKEENLTFSTGLTRTTNTITTNDSQINHNSLENTHNLTTNIDHNTISNTHNLTTDINHNTITNNHNLTTDINHNTILNNHNLTTDINHNTITNNHNLTTDIDHNALTNYTITEHRVINDSSVLNTDLWSASKISSELGTKEPTIIKNTAFNKNFETNVSNIKMNGSSSIGTTELIAKSDHIHPSDTTKENIINKGQADGYCELDSGAKVPLNRLPSTLLVYKGVWDALNNVPELVTPDINKKGWVYNVNVPGTRFGIEWKLGDWAIFNDFGIIEKSDNSDDVVSVNSQQGVVVLKSDDISDIDETNKWTNESEKTIWNAKEEALTFSTGLTRTTNTITTNDSQINHNSLQNTHNLTTDINHNTILNNHNLTTDIDHNTITNTHNLTTDINHNTILNNHNLTTDIDHNTITNTHNLTTDIDHTQITNKGLNTHDQIDSHITKHENVLDITQEPTGFTDPENVIVSYDSVARTVTLSGNVEAYYKGNLITELISGWESPAHLDATGLFFLQYNPIDGFTFSDSPFTYTNVLIAVVFRDTANFNLREVHGLMQWQSHRHFHETVGTYLQSGGDLGNYVLASTTAIDRRPNISQTKIIDEDLPSVLPELNTNAYSRLNLSAANTTNISNDNTEIINLETNQPYWNEFTGGVWQQTLFANNSYGKIFVMAVPVTADVESQKQRFVFIQPQLNSTSLDTIRGVTANDINLGHITAALPEYCFIGEIIIRYTGGDWSITEVNKLTGSRITQVSSPTGNYLSTVTSDTTLDGEGTTTSPLSVNIGTSDLNDVNLTGIENNKILKYNSVTSEWEIADDNDTTYTAIDFDIKDLSDSLDLRTTWSNKQDLLVSGTNIKTINSESILGSGNILIEGSSYTFSTGLSETLGVVTTNDSQINHNSLQNTHNLTTDIDHNSITNGHNLTTDINHNALTNYTITEHRVINDSSILNTDLWSASKISSELGGKQATLVSGTNIKTINSTSLLGLGNIVVQEPLTAGTDYEVPLNFSTGLTRVTNTITINDSQINHNSLNNTHNLTTDINHNNITNGHNLTTDIDHNTLTNYNVAEHRVINDSSTTTTVLWSGSKISTELGTKEPSFTKNTAFNKNFGTTTGTVCQGDDLRLSDARTPTIHNASLHSDINQSLLTTSTPTFQELTVYKTSNFPQIYIDYGPSGQKINLGAGTAGASIGTTTFLGFGTITGRNFAGWNERMRIDSTGNVGINDSSPSERLSVGGRLKSTGAIMTGDLFLEGNVITDSTIGVKWHSNNDYAIHRTTGAWTEPDYQQLNIKWRTGIILNPGNGQFGKSFVDVIGTLKATTLEAGGLNLGSGNLNSVENIYLDNTIISEGDTNTFLQFHAADQWRVVTGGGERLEVNNSGIKLNNAGATINEFSIDGTMSGNSDTAVPTEKAVKTFAVEKSGLNKISVSATAPTGASTGDLWVDTS